MQSVFIKHDQIDGACVKIVLVLEKVPLFPLVVHMGHTFFMSMRHKWSIKKSSVFFK